MKLIRMMEYLNCKTNAPSWHEVTVASHVPQELEKLSEMAHNLWWTWHDEATALYAGLDPELWEKAGHNPIVLLEMMSYERLEALSADPAFIAKMNDIYTRFHEYMDEKPDAKRPSVAYFSMEYGLNKILKIYSGGLGVLAGDYLKEASCRWFRMLS